MWTTKIYSEKDKYAHIIKIKVFSVLSIIYNTVHDINVKYSSMHKRPSQCT